MPNDLDVIESMRSAFSTPATQVAQVSTTTGTATSDSADGFVMVDLGGASFNASGEQSTELPTQVDVRSGDTVMVTLVGGSPVVTGVVGGGDRTRESIAPAVTRSETWYMLATDETPAQPTEDSHDGWTDTEPIWDEDSSQQLWASVRTETIGDSVTWSAPSKVSAWANVTVARNAIVSTVEESYETKADASATYATKSEVEQTSTALDVRITSAEGTASDAQSTASDALAKADATQTLVRAYEGGVLVAKRGQTYGALVNADGSFDVRPVTWDAGGSPTVGDYVASFWKGGMKVKTDDVGEGYVDIDASMGTTTFGSDWATYVEGRQLHLNGTVSGTVDIDADILKANHIAAGASLNALGKVGYNNEIGKTNYEKSNGNTNLYGNTVSINTKAGCTFNDATKTNRFIVKSASGNLFELPNSNGNCVLGYGLYAAGSGDTNIYGNNINILSKQVVAINGHPLKNQTLQTWTAFPVAVQSGQKKFYVQNGIATLACDFQLKTSCAAWGANFLTAAQQTVMKKYAPAITDMKIASLGSTGIIWTLSFDPANNRICLWPTGGTAPASSYLTTTFMWQVN